MSGGIFNDQTTYVKYAILIGRRSRRYRGRGPEYSDYETHGSYERCGEKGSLCAIPAAQAQHFFPENNQFRFVHAGYTFERIIGWPNRTPASLRRKATLSYGSFGLCRRALEIESYIYDVGFRVNG